MISAPAIRRCPICQSFPFDKIKIDRSFISGLDGNPQCGAIVRAAIGLGHGLNLPVIAEGVETESQMEFLRREKCDEVQGHFIGKPRPIAEYADMLADPASVRPVAAPQVQAAPQRVILFDAFS